MADYEQDEWTGASGEYVEPVARGYGAAWLAACLAEDAVRQAESTATRVVCRNAERRRPSMIDPQAAVRAGTSTEP